MNKRTITDFSKHELIITKNDNYACYDLKRPDSEYSRRVKFINIDNVLVVKGDYGNWIFSREFHPSANEGVSDGYWCEKLEIHSIQKARKYNSDATRNKINEIIKEEEDLTEEEIEYLNECLNVVDDEEYYHFAFNNNCGRFNDYEHVPFVKTINSRLLIVFDAFDEICLRLKKNNLNERGQDDTI